MPKPLAQQSVCTGDNVANALPTSESLGPGHAAMRHVARDRAGNTSGHACSAQSSPRYLPRPKRSRRLPTHLVNFDLSGLESDPPAGMRGEGADRPGANVGENDGGGAASLCVLPPVSSNPYVSEDGLPPVFVI